MLHKSRLFYAAFGFAFVCLGLNSTLAVYGTSNAPTYTAPVNLSNDVYQAHFPWIANSGNSIYVAWTEEIHGIYFRSSSDGGSTWNPPLSSPAMRLSTKLKGIGVADYPIVNANGSDVYVVWSQIVNTSGVNVLQIFFAGSTNGGASFSQAIQLTSGSSTNGWITPVIAASGPNVYVAYTGNGKNSFVIWSNNYGAAGSWSIPHQYASTHEPQIAAWGNNAYAIADGVEIAVTNNAGATWTQESTKTGQGDEPWIATSGAYVYIVSQTKGTNSIVHFFYSNNFGQPGSWINQTYSKQADLSSVVPQHDAWEPQIAAIGNYVYLTFHELNSPVSNYVRVSTDNGLHWGKPFALTTSGLNGFVTQIATNGCNGGYSCTGTPNPNVFLIWPQIVNVGGTHYWHMFIASSSNFGSGWTTNDVSNPTGTSGPNNDIATSSITANGGTAFAVYQYQATTSSNYQVMFIHS